MSLSAYPDLHRIPPPPICTEFVPGSPGYGSISLKSVCLRLVHQGTTHCCFCFFSSMTFLRTFLCLFESHWCAVCILHSCWFYYQIMLKIIIGQNIPSLSFSPLSESLDTMDFFFFFGMHVLWTRAHVKKNDAKKLLAEGSGGDYIARTWL